MNATRTGTSRPRVRNRPLDRHGRRRRPAHVVGPAHGGRLRQRWNIGEDLGQQASEQYRQAGARVGDAVDDFLKKKKKKKKKRERGEKGGGAKEVERDATAAKSTRLGGIDQTHRSLRPARTRSAGRPCRVAICFDERRLTVDESGVLFSQGSPSSRDVAPRGSIGCRELGGEVLAVGIAAEDEMSRRFD